MVDTDRLRGQQKLGRGRSGSTAIQSLPNGRELPEGGETQMLNELMTFVQSLTARLSLRDESGQALVEYGLLVGLIAVACIIAVTALGVDISGAFNTISGDLAGLA
jgi:pilus assembly protein Flp/PilA